MQTSHFTRSDGTLAYSDYGGDGPPVLMLPGMGALRTEYRFLAPRLRDAGYHALTMDLRGHGESSVPWETYDVPAIGCDIVEFVEYLAQGPVYLIGTSKAAASVVWAAAERPDLVRAQVLIGPFVRAVPLNPIMGAMFWLMMHNPWRVHAWAMYYASIYPSHKPEDFPTYMHNLKQNLAQPERFDAVNAVGNASPQPSEERLARLKTPSLVIMGTHDPDFGDPAGEGETIAHRTGGTLALVEGAGHYPQTEMPDITTPIILDFLQHG